jgi:hypothetical protein
MLTINTVLTISDDPNKYLILHEHAVFVFLKSDIKLKGSVVSGPGVAASVAPVFEVASLQTLYHKELAIVPFAIVFLKEFGEDTLARPFHGDPLKRLELALCSCSYLVLDGQLSVDIVLDLLDGRVSTLLRVLYSWLLNRHLKPVGYFKYVPFL